MLETPTLKQIIKQGGTADLVGIRSGIAYYDIDTTIGDNGSTWRIPVSIEDMQDTWFEASMRPARLMRWIRKGLEVDSVTVAPSKPHEV